MVARGVVCVRPRACVCLGLNQREGEADRCRTHARIFEVAPFTRTPHLFLAQSKLLSHQPPVPCVPCGVWTIVMELGTKISLGTERIKVEIGGPTVVYRKPFFSVDQSE